MDNKRRVEAGVKDNRYTIAARKVRKDKKTSKIVKIVILVLALFALFSYLIIGFIYNSESFAITLDNNLYYERGLVIYEDPEYKAYRSELVAESIDGFDNIAENWIAEDVHNEANGSHNGDNYIAYTFYIENVGDKISHYYTRILIEDVIKDVDEAVRIRLYKNDEIVTYAKEAYNGEAEPNTIKFDSEEVVMQQKVENFEPGSIDKYTVVVWLEGRDPQCTNSLYGGEFKMKMEFNSEIIEK